MKVLVLHGFTSSMETVSGLEPGLRERGLAFAMPRMRGHGTRPEDLRGVVWRDWLEDGRQALLDLTSEGERTLVIGLSMGGLVALHLAAEHPTRVAGVATVAACLRFRSPLLKALPVLRRMFTYWKSSPDYADSELAKFDNNYPYFPLSALASLVAYTEVVDTLLPRVQAPLCVAAARQDPVVHPSSTRRITDRCGSLHREVHWFEKSRHEMLRDVEREQVFECLLDFAERVGEERL